MSNTNGNGYCVYAIVCERLYVCIVFYPSRDSMIHACLLYTAAYATVSDMRAFFKAHVLVSFLLILLTADSQVPRQRVFEVLEHLV